MAALDKKEWKALQREMNRWTDRYLRGKTHLIADGEPGTLTHRRIEGIKYYLGYGRDRNATVTREFLNRMRRTRTRKVFGKGSMFNTGSRRRVRQRAAYRAARVAVAVTPGVTTYNGVPVAKCAVPILRWCAAHGWPGQLLSGWRSIPYSISLCFRRCGRPSCPGTCGGAATNHVGKTCSRFAVDVTAYEKFRQVVARCPFKQLGCPRIFNALPNDRPHFSPSGR